MVNTEIRLRLRSGSKVSTLQKGYDPTIFRVYNNERSCNNEQTA